MDQERIKSDLRAALEREVATLSSLPDMQAKAAFVLLFEGAETRLMERMKGYSLGIAHSSEYFRRGAEIADSIAISNRD